MDNQKFMQKLIGVILAIIFLAGCGVPTAAPAATPTVPPPPPPPPPLLPSVQPAQPTATVSTCKPNGWPLGTLRSTDHGATWITVEGCIHDIGSIMPADLTPQVVDGRIVLYFVDLMNLAKGILYRVSSEDGMNFDKPLAVYDNQASMMDPYVLRMPDGSFRMYATSDPGIISAASSDGVSFTTEGAVQSSNGGPLGFLFGAGAGALVTPDNQIRLFLGTANPQAIISLISNDGLTFTPEEGLRIALPPDYFTIGNPEPIRLPDGSYLMLYSTQDKVHEGRPEWDAEIHLATSVDGFNWIANPTVIGYGGTVCVAEAPDGTLYIYGIPIQSEGQLQ